MDKLKRHDEHDGNPMNEYDKQASSLSNGNEKHEFVTDFFNTIATVVEQARGRVERTVNLTMCVTYYEVGQLIVEQEQNGASRAAYGAKLLSDLSSYLTERCGKGWSVGNLKNARPFYMVYSSEIRKSAIGECENRQSLYGYFKLSWTHYLVLMRIKDKQVRRFYEVETVNQQWSVRQLKRQHESSLFERLALSRDKNEVMRLATDGQTIDKPSGANFAERQ